MEGGGLSAAPDLGSTGSGFVSRFGQKPSPISPQSQGGELSV